MSFTAHIRNNGNTAVSGFSYRWYIEGVASTGLVSYPGTVYPGAVAQVSMKWPWPADLSDHTVKIVVDPRNEIGDTLRRNNTYTDHTNALSFSIWVEQKLYEKFNARLNGFGTYSFDDWFRWQFDRMKTNFLRSKYPVIAPDGILERIRVEEINVIPFDPNDLNNWRTVMNNDPHLYLNDGRWQFTSDRQTLAEKEQDWNYYADTFATQIDWGLIHEMAHQLGIIDEYRMNTGEPIASYNQVTWADGTPVGMAHLFHRGGLMGGGYVIPGYDGSAFDSHTAGYMNRNLHFRRGYYGDYLFDVPKRNIARVFDIAGNPLADATISFYQKDPYTEVISNTPVFKGRTDANGLFPMPNRATRTVTTATGHSLRANPFGEISVVGTNGTMLVKFAKHGQEDFRWFEIIQPNIAFWMGNAEEATYDFRTSILPQNVRIGKTNLALNRPSTASSNATMAGNANDGNTTDPNLTWMPGSYTAGQWWQVDLGTSRRICRVVVYPWAGNPHDWYSRFHFEISTTGAFAGEQRIVRAEKNLDQTRGAGDYEMQRLTGFGNRAMYTFPIKTGRFFRIVGDIDQNWVQLQEIQLFEAIDN